MTHGALHPFRNDKKNSPSLPQTRARFFSFFIKRWRHQHQKHQQQRHNEPWKRRERGGGGGRFGRIEWKTCQLKCHAERITACLAARTIAHRNRMEFTTKETKSTLRCHRNSTFDNDKFINALARPERNIFKDLKEHFCLNAIFEQWQIAFVDRIWIWPRKYWNFTLCWNEWV